MGHTEAIGIGTDMSLGTYPEHTGDPWGGPDYGDPFAEYGRKVTADPRSPKRSLKNFSDYAEVVSLVERLEARGYSSEDVGKILGENYLRVARHAWGA